ncbi:MAG: chloride channel protein [Gammaproteobacteria bacterium]
MVGRRFFPAQEKLLSITLLGAFAGLLSGAVVLLFRFAIDAGQGIFLPEGKVGNYEALSPSVRLALPIAGALLLAFFLHWVPKPIRQVGVVHVLDRFWSPNQTAALPLSNALTQFAAGSVAIISGHSVDREGPGVHLGAAAASLLGQRFGVAQEDLRTLVACGTAASIAAAFNTPLAGVVFVIEVIRVRYTVPRFMPVLLAAVVGGVIAHAFYGSTPAFDVLPVKLASLSELPSLALLGLLIGLLAAAFVALCEWIAERSQEWPILPAMALAGAITGTMALWAPTIMGVGYDALDKILRAEFSVGSLLTIVACKLVATAAAIGLRVPGGLIGSTILMGAAAGAAWGLLTEVVPLGQLGSPSFYAMIGMAAMMGAALRAPLAALIALLELTANPNIILPGLLALVCADGVARKVLGRDSVFFSLLKVQPSQGRA